MRLKNEVIVGLVVVAGLLVLAFGGYWLTGRQWGGQPREITATFQRVACSTRGGRSSTAASTSAGWSASCSPSAATACSSP